MSRILRLRPRVTASLAALVLLAAPAFAQLPDWSSVAITPGSPVNLEQNLCVVRDGSVVRAYSCVTREWATLNAVWTPTPAVTIQNESCIVQDGPVFYGYSPRTGIFSPKLTLSGTASLVPLGSPQTWHSIVVDGNVVHAYFAISGHWETYVFAGPPAVTNGRFCFLVDDGSAIYAVSSYYGSLVPLGVPGATVNGAYGSAGMADSAGLVHGFSASRNTWASLPVFGPPALAAGNAQAGCVAIQDGVQIAFFSGYTGAFTMLGASAAATVTLQRAAAIVVDGSVVYGYSALLSASNALALSPGAAPGVMIQQFFGIVGDGATTIAYSAATNNFSAYPVPAAQVLTAAQVALATDAAGAPLAVYSSFHDAWIAVPANLNAPVAHLSATSVVLAEAGGGLHALAMQGTAWQYQPTPALDVVLAGTSPPALAESFYASAGNTVYTFNPIYEGWRTTVTSGLPVLRKAHHHVTLVLDGAAAYAYSNWSDRWTVRPLSGAPLTTADSNAQVQSAFVRDGGMLHVFSGVDQLSIVPEFPRYFRPATQGSLLRLDLAGEAGAPAILVTSPITANIPLGLAGTLLVDPSFFLVLAQPVIPPGRVFTLTFQVPVIPGISGQQLHFQAAVVGPAGPYLTRRATATFF